MAVRFRTIPSAQAPAIPAEQCEHIWNPQTNTCIRCLLPADNHAFVQTSPVSPGPVQSIAPPTVNPLVAALTKVEPKEEELPPWEAPEGYTILDALREYGRGQRKGVLRLIAKNGGASYQVQAYNEHDGRATLLGPSSMVLKPILGTREVPLYNPFWG